MRLVEMAAVAVLALPLAAASEASTCYGTTADGALEDGCRLPSGGGNFTSFTRLAGLLGRTWVHCAVAEVVAGSYASLASSHPDLRFVLGESGRRRGGEFRPHRTHRNGLSVDFMVPVVDRYGASVPLPAGFTNKFGYGIEFDSEGRYDGLGIDFEALAAHLAALGAAAQAAGVGIRRVIFDPALQPRLRQTAAWPAIRALRFSTQPAWVRHDEHYHVDFELPCRPLREWGQDE